MSRVILARHPNGEEHIVVGFDNPLGFYFADRYDEDGECLETRGYISGEVYLSPDAIEELAARWGAMKTSGLARRLEEHARLEYPASNLVEDWTT
jgi:hypothetical protein